MVGRVEVIPGPLRQKLGCGHGSRGNGWLGDADWLGRMARHVRGWEMGTYLLGRVSKWVVWAAMGFGGWGIFY